MTPRRAAVSLFNWIVNSGVQFPTVDCQIQMAFAKKCIPLIILLKSIYLSQQFMSLKFFGTHCLKGKMVRENYLHF